MRVVLDTSVVVAAMRSDQGAAAELLRQLQASTHEICLDLKLFLEYCEVCHRQEHAVQSGMCHAEIEAFLESLRDFSTPILNIARLRPLLRDPEDEMVLELAVAAHADVIVTHNLRDLLPAYTLFGIRVVPPAEFLFEAVGGHHGN